MHRRHGFSLVELMITLAIVGILASIAIPMYREAQGRARLAEVPMLLDGIVSAEVAYEASHDAYVLVWEFRPDEVPGKHARAWDGADFDTLGWSPDGAVRGSYAVFPSDAYGVEVHGISDVDGDSAWSWWVATPVAAAHSITGTRSM